MRKHIYKYIFLFVVLCITAQTQAYAQGPAAFSDPGTSSGGGSAGGTFTPVAPNVDGGAIPIGATAQVVVRFRNDGSQPVQAGLIRLYPSSTVSATIALNQCETDGQIAPGAECAVALSVKGLQSGSWRVEMLMSHSGRSRLVTATLSGTVDAGSDGASKLTSDIEAIPDEVDFETLNDSQRLVEPVVLRNITSTPITISDVYIDASDSSGYSLKTECKVLQPGQACIATVSWSPRLKGRTSGVLVVKHDGPTALSSVSITGEYDPDKTDEAEVFPEAVPGRGLMVASQSELDFGTDVDAAATITVSLINAGDSDMTISDISMGGTDNGLSFKDGGCQNGQVLKPVEACPLTVSWSPTRVGALLDDVQVVHDGARGVLILPVRGEASGVVSKDQGTVMISAGGTMMSPGMNLAVEPIRESDLGEDDDISDKPSGGSGVTPVSSNSVAGGFVSNVANPSSVLDGLKITSFSPNRAIVSGPSGSRIIYDKEDVVLGGVPWSVKIQRNGIEFTNSGQTVLLLFDRSLSSVNRVKTTSGSSSSNGSSSSSTTTE